MTYSVQQVKFEFLNYMKEFGPLGESWTIGTAVEAKIALFERNGVDPSRDIWLWKPMMSKVAARIVQRWFADRFGVKTAPFIEDEGAHVFLFKSGEPTPKKASDS